jgi:hypothetical protein
LQSKAELTRLAAMCGKVADDASTFGAELSEKARALQKEWLVVTGEGDASLALYKDLKQIHAKKEALKTRMVDLFFGV